VFIEVTGARSHHERPSERSEKRKERQEFEENVMLPS
jgi:hypothetical protein